MMAKSMMVVSDKSGEPILDGGYVARISNGKGFWVADLTSVEGTALVDELNARSQKKRGRPKAAAIAAVPDEPEE